MLAVAVVRVPVLIYTGRCRRKKERKRKENRIDLRNKPHTLTVALSREIFELPHTVTSNNMRAVK